MSNVSLNRPAIDVFGAITWLDPAIGWDLSAAAGFTFNRTNTATDYKTGDEFHLEWAATKYLTKEFTIGMVGYFYQQLTPDSGTGARLGGFEGRVVALGGSIGYTFELESCRYRHASRSIASSTCRTGWRAPRDTSPWPSRSRSTPAATLLPLKPIKTKF